MSISSPPIDAQYLHFWARPQVTSALGFSVQYFGNYKVVNNSIAGEVYVLYQCVTQQPPVSDFPPGTRFFQVPLTSVSSPETVPFAFMVRRRARLLGDRCRLLGPTAALLGPAAALPGGGE